DTDLYAKVYSEQNVAAWAAWDAALPKAQHMMHVLEAFNGRYFFDIEGIPTQTNEGARNGLNLIGSSSGSGGGSDGNSGFFTTLTLGLELSIQQLEFMERSYAALKQSVYGAIAMQTRLKPYLDAIDLRLDFSASAQGSGQGEAQALSFDFTRLEAQLASREAADAREAFFDLLDLNLYAGSMLGDAGWNGWTQLAKAYGDFEADEQVQKTMSQFMTGSRGVQITASNADTWWLGTAGDDTLLLRSSDDVVFAGAGNDTLYGNLGADVLFGGSGNDRINGSGVLAGGRGDDDISSALNSADTIVFNLGDGSDTVSVFEWGRPEQGAKDILRLGAGIAPSDVRFERSAGDLVIKIGGGGDQIRMKNWYSGGYDRSYELKQIEFADGTVWDRSVMAAQTVYQTGTAGNDSLSGAKESPNVIDGGAGHDNLHSDSAADDVIDGGEGNDSISASYGRNTLRGGAGNDRISGTGVLEGGTGDDVIDSALNSADTIVFNLGDGSDTVSVFEWQAPEVGAKDILRLGAGIAPSDVRFEQGGNDLIIKVGSADDQVRVKNWYSGGYDRSYELKAIEFADGTVWDRSVIAAQTVYQTGTDSSESLRGSSSKDVIEGRGGNDYIVAGDGDNVIHGGDGADNISAGSGHDLISGGAGDDYLYDVQGKNVLLGGAGNDRISGSGVLMGGAGNDVIESASGSADTIVFNLGDGSDTVSVLEWARPEVGAKDRLRLGEGIDSADVYFERGGSDLIIKLGTAGDQVRMKDWYSSWTDRSYELKAIEFADGTVWDRAAMAARPVYAEGTGAAQHAAQKTIDAALKLLFNPAPTPIDPWLAARDFGHTAETMPDWSADEEALAREQVARQWKKVSAYFDQGGADADGQWLASENLVATAMLFSGRDTSAAAQLKTEGDTSGARDVDAAKLY
ncbi:MAG TPA: calcium-binding protein, partial [Burkholderiaceae bacterium]|nr:calcium-binding protein [Burkholderiaceae bacterium]